MCKQQQNSEESTSKTSTDANYRHNKKSKAGEDRKVFNFPWEIGTEMTDLHHFMSSGKFQRTRVFRNKGKYNVNQ